MYLFESEQAHQARDRRRKPRENLAASAHRKAAFDFNEPIDGDRHIRLVRPDDADVMAIMPDRRGDGAALHAEAIDESDGDVAVDPMTADDGDFDHVLA